MLPLLSTLRHASRSNTVQTNPIAGTLELWIALLKLYDLKGALMRNPVTFLLTCQIRTHGVAGLYRGLFATILFRSFFFFQWGSYDVLTHNMKEWTSLSIPAINFWAGGISAQIFWTMSYPADVVKQRLMTDPMGGVLGDGQRRFHWWKDAAIVIYQERGWRGYWRGFVPCVLRAFPANGTALAVFEGVTRLLL